METKIVITIKDTGGVVGISRTECDPQFFQVKDLPAALAGIPVFLPVAEKNWEVSPRNPVTTVELNPPKPSATKTAAKPVPAKPAQVSKPVPKVQNAMF